MILGIDEVGRGPWAGPLVVGAVVLPEEWPWWVEELRDSKRLSERHREELSELIWEEAEAAGLGWVWHYEIDEIGMNEALREATRRAVRDMKENYSGVQFSEVIIDGNQNFLVGTPLEKWVTTLVKGDDLIKEVSAASIIAKVARDRYMIDLAEEYPDYYFENHKGYGTQKHIAALKNFGVTPEHRLSLRPVRRVVGLPMPPKKKKRKGEGNQEAKKAKEVATLIGRKAEQKVAEFLESEGHELVARNYKNRICEIDIISVKGEEIYFTEVRYRKNDEFGSGMESVTLGKRRQIEFAARVFLANRPEFEWMNPRLAVADVTGENFTIQDWVILDE